MASEQRKNVVVTIRMTEGQAEHLRLRAEHEGWGRDELRQFVIASMLIGVGTTPRGQYLPTLRRMRDAEDPRSWGVAE